MNIHIFVRSFLVASLFVIATFPVTGIAATSETGYDNYLLFTQELGKTIAGGITEGVEKTSLLYKSAWSELTSFSSFSVKFPAVTIPSLRGGALSSYTQFSQNLGEAYADNFINYVSGTETIGDAIAGGIKDGFAGSANLYTQSLAKSKSLVTNTTTDTTQSLASIGSTLDSISTSVSTFWKNLFPVSSPTPIQPTTPTKVVTPKTVTPTIVTQPKPPVTTTTPTPVPKTTTVTPATNITGTEIPPTQPIVTNIVLPTTSSSELNTKIEQLRNELLAKIGSLSSRDDAHYQGNFQAIALTNKIDQLTNTVITNPTITGASITGGSISGASISGSIAGSSGTFSGNLTVSGTATSTFAGDSAFDTDTLYVDSLNNRVGIATSSPSDTFSLNGAAYLAQVSAPAVTVNRLYNESGNLTWNGTVIGGASTGQWTLSGSDVYRSSGNVGIGTTSPYAKLSVVGETVSSYFTATSTTATNYFAGNVMIGTTTATVRKLALQQSADSQGIRIYGFDDESASYLDMYVNNNGVPSFAGVNSGAASDIFFTEGVLINADKDFSFGGSQQFSMQYDAGTDSFLFQDDNQVNTRAVFGSTGNFGIGTTSPYAKLSVVGEVVASHFTATSTTATSTFQGTLLAASGGNVGIGTTTPNMAKLSIGGTLLASGHGAFGNESLLNTPDWYWTTSNNVLSVRENSSGQGSLPVTGIYAEAIRTPHATNASSGSAIGVSAIGRLDGTVAIWSDSIYGGSFVGVNSSTYTVTNIYGVYGNSYVAGAGGITHARGGYFDVINGGGGGTIANAYGVSVGNIAIAGTNTYGVHVATQTSGGANSYAFYSAGASDKSYFAGKIGIGTTTPNNKLDIYSTTQAAIGFTGASGDTYKWTIGMDKTNGGRFSIASSTALGTLDRFVINGAGNVGIGTTSPYAKLSVVGQTVSETVFATSTGTVSAPSVAIGAPNVGFYAVNAGLLDLTVSGTKVWEANNGAMYASNTNSWYLTTASSANSTTLPNIVPNRADANTGFASGSTGNINVIIGGAEMSRWTSTGFGIGTTSPYAKLSVVGNVVATNFIATTTAENGFSGAAGSLSLPTYSFAGDSDTGIYSAGGNAIGFAVGGVQRMVVDTAVSVRGGAILYVSAGSASAPGVVELNDANTGLFFPTADNLGLSVGGVEGARLTSVGLGIGTTSPYAKLSVVGEVVASHFTATSTTATTTISGGLNVGNGAILYDYSSGVASVGNLELGSLNFDTNAGTVSWMDMPVTSTATAGTVESYTAQIDGTALITAYSQSDGAGNIKLSAVGIGTTTPSARLTVTTATSTENIPLFTVASSTGATLFTILNSGYVGIGTTTSAVTNTLVVQGGVCITGGTTCPAVSSGSLSVDTAGVSGGDDPGDVFDIAERYPASETMEAGDIASLDGTTDDAAVVHKGVAGETLIGIVSTKAAVGINGSTLVLAPDQEATSTKPLIALAGRVPVKVTMEGGVIKKGDRITASSIPGVGKRATSTSEQTVGIALEKKETDGTVLVFVQTSPTRLDPAVADGTILDGNGESSFWSVEEGSGRIKFISQGIDLNDQEIVSVRAITGSAGKWSIDASGRLVVNEIQTNKLCVGETCVTESQFKEVFGNSQTATVSTTPPPAQEETTAPSSTPPVVEDESANEESPAGTTDEPVADEPAAEEETVEPEPEPAPEPTPEEAAEETTEEETPVATSTPA